MLSPLSPNLCFQDEEMRDTRSDSESGETDNEIEEEDVEEDRVVEDKESKGALTNNKTVGENVGLPAGS